MRRQLTVQERVLLHLHDRKMNDNAWDAPIELSQSGVSNAVGVHRRHLPRTMRSLQESGMINIELRHVTNIKRKVQVYSLTSKGQNMATDLLERILIWEVETDNGRVPLSSICKESSDVLQYLYPSSDMYDSPSVGRLAELVKVAYEDGILTTAEERLLDTAAQELHVDRDTLERIKQRISTDKTNGFEARLIKSALMTALADGYIDSNEEKILRKLAIESNIDHEAYSTLVERTLSECLSLEERAYFGAMEAISWSVDDSNSFIIDLRNALGIDSEQHDRLSTLNRAKLN
ncbi:MAG: hypothetical protein VXX50_06755 [Candidatus Thermoplasmatota archaeon]|nr:hypothetical protein [Candidatus Thermoplasmatota archaeon]